MIKIGIQDKNYPEQLKKIEKPPTKLYINGDETLVNQKGIAIVGSRSCSDYGRRMARKFAQELSEIGLIIISGMAIGIDTEAHKGCIKNKGKTIAVLPCGFENIYPEENEDLYREILQTGGTVISEYSPNEKAGYKKYVARNRIVSGLAIATIVVEAGYRSGTGITARLTKEQGKEVFCIPSNIDSKYSIGTNKLIQEGAKLLTSIKDIIDNVEQLKNITYKPKPAMEEIKSEYYNVYKEIGERPIDLNSIYKRTGGNIADITFQLTMLEIDGYIKQLPNGFYIKS